MAKFFIHTYWAKIIQSFEIMALRGGVELSFVEKINKALRRIDLIPLSREIADETVKMYG